MCSVWYAFVILIVGRGSGSDMKLEQGAPSLTPITESHQEDSRQAASSASAAANISMAASQLQTGSPSEEATSPQLSSPDTSSIRNPSPPSQQFNESVREPDDQRQQPSGSTLPGPQLTRSADDGLYGSGDSFTESSKDSYNHPSSVGEVRNAPVLLQAAVGKLKYSPNSTVNLGYN